MHLVCGKFAWQAWGLAACLGLAGCSSTEAGRAAGSAGSGATDQTEAGGSNSGGAGATGDRAMGGARHAGGSGPLSSPGCEHVVVPSSELYTSDGSTPNAIAAWNDQLYLLTGDGKFQTVRVIDGTKLAEIARVPDDDDQIDLTPSTLSVDSRGLFFDGYQGGRNRLIGVPFAGGEGVQIADLSAKAEALGSWFVSDDRALYFVADGDGGRVLQSAPRQVKKAVAPLRITDDTAFYEGLTALGRVGQAVFTVDGAVSDFVVREFPAVPDDPPAHGRLAAFTLKDCRSFAIPPRVVSGDDSLYVGCNSDGNERSYIFRLPPVAEWPEDEETISLEPVASGTQLDEDSFVVVAKDVYFHDVDANDDDHVYRVSESGGSPTRVLDTHSVHHMASDGKTLFVEGSCGIQAISL